MKVTLTRLDDAFHFEARGEGGVSMQFDAGPDIGGHGLGVRPMQALLMAVGSCSAIDVLLILKKQRQLVTDCKIEIDGARLTHVAHGVIAPKDSLPFSERLLALFEGISAIVAEHAPHEAAVEETFMNNNAASALKLGHARAMALVVPARAGLPVAEYAATVVKKSVVGTGAADKTQVAFMIARLLPKAGPASADAADALAVAIAHAHARKARKLGAAA